MTIYNIKDLNMFFFFFLAKNKKRCEDGFTIFICILLFTEVTSKLNEQMVSVEKLLSIGGVWLSK